MAALVAMLEKWYPTEIWVLDHVKHFFLLILRLYFGWGFMSAGLGKLLNVETHTGFFRDWGIPLPMLNVYLAGTTETVCGFLLLIGAASRIITIPLLGTMFVAYLTAHTEQLYALLAATRRSFQGAAIPVPVHLLRRDCSSGPASCRSTASSSGSWNSEPTIQPRSPAASTAAEHPRLAGLDGPAPDHLCFTRRTMNDSSSRSARPVPPGTRRPGRVDRWCPGRLSSVAKTADDGSADHAGWKSGHEGRRRPTRRPRCSRIRTSAGASTPARTKARRERQRRAPARPTVPPWPPTTAAA